MAPTATKILVGTMADRKNTERDREIPSKRFQHKHLYLNFTLHCSDVQKVVRDLNFITSIECRCEDLRLYLQMNLTFLFYSAKTDPGSVEEVFSKCFENLLNPPSPDNIDCNPFKFFKQLKF